MGPARSHLLLFIYRNKLAALLAAMLTPMLACHDVLLSGILSLGFIECGDHF